ncbi:unnamed protein product, partial [Polarella glacialis]
RGDGGLTEAEYRQLQDGNALAQLTLDLIRSLEAGVLWSMENPANSFEFRDFAEFMKSDKVSKVVLDMCAYDGSSRKPTQIMSNSHEIKNSRKICPGISDKRLHDRLEGQVYDKHQRKVVYKTKLAQVYGMMLCMAYAIFQVKGIAAGSMVNNKEIFREHQRGWSSAGQFAASFEVITPPKKRKRALGTPCKYDPPPRQETRGRHAMQAGYKAKRGIAPPLLPKEMEPGQAVTVVLNVQHPLTQDVDLDQDSDNLIEACVDDPKLFMRDRELARRFWKNRAEMLRGATAKELNAIPDPALRRLYCGNRSTLTGKEPFGSFLHIALWREMAKKTGSVDAKYVEEMLARIHIVGAVARSHRWPELDREPEIGMKEYVSFSLGPFYDQCRVSSVVGDKTWVCTERIDVEQKGGKVREVDSATVSMSSSFARQFWIMGSLSEDAGRQDLRPNMRAGALSPSWSNGLGSLSAQPRRLFINGMLHDSSIAADTARTISRLLCCGQGLRGGDPKLSSPRSPRTACLNCLLSGAKCKETLQHFLFVSHLTCHIRAEPDASLIWQQRGSITCLRRDVWTFAHMKLIRRTIMNMWASRQALLQRAFYKKRRRHKVIIKKTVSKHRVVIFTDGVLAVFQPTIGAVVFDKWSAQAFYISLVVPQEVIDEWLPRATQIAMVELLAPVVVNHVFGSRLANRNVILMVDSEPVEGTLVKGYSSRSDMCWLTTSVFWQQALDLRSLYYIDRVPTDANISDGPSRNRFREAEQAQWVRIHAEKKGVYCKP